MAFSIYCTVEDTFASAHCFSTATMAHFPNHEGIPLQQHLYQGSSQGVHQSLLHIVLRRYSIQEILDDAEIEVYTECISWKRNPPSCHTIWHHWPDRILFVPYPCMMTTGISCQPEY